MLSFFTHEEKKTSDNVLYFPDAVHEHNELGHGEVMSTGDGKWQTLVCTIGDFIFQGHQFSLHTKLQIYCSETGILEMMYGSIDIQTITL